MRPGNELFRRLERFVGRLGDRKSVGWVAALATLLSATSVSSYRVLDDWVLGLIAQGRGAAVGLQRGAFDLFTFTVGDPANNRRLEDVGVMLPWWTDDTLRIAFFRPIASLTHVLDERLWPANPVLMHVQSLIWFALMLLAAALVYIRIEDSPVVAGLAFALFALDDAHGSIVAWLSNRNALIAGALGFLAVAAHDSWRRGNRPMAVAGPLTLAAGLGAGELSVGALGYLAAYAAFLDRGTKLARAASIAPYVLVVSVWRYAWTRAGYGARGSGAYIDPLSDPVEFLSAAPAKLVMLLHGQFSAPPADVASLAPPSDRPLQLTVGCLTIAVVVWLLAPFVRDPRGRFWALGSVLALLPLAATLPSDRLLVFVGLGSMALLARLFRPFVAAGANGELRLGPRSFFTAMFLLLQLGLAPLLLAGRAAQMTFFANAVERGMEHIPRDDSVKGKTLVLLAAPTVLFANYIQPERELLGIPRPEHLYLLAGASSNIALERTGPTEIVLRPSAGFLYTPIERHYRGATMRPGDRVVLSTMVAEVIESGADGRPSAVRFSFTAPLDRYAFARWIKGRYELCDLPGLGEKMTLPEEDIGRIVLAAAFAL